MSILTDRQIAKRCNPPTHRWYYGTYWGDAISPPYTSKEKTAIDSASSLIIVKGPHAVSLEISSTKRNDLPEFEPMISPFKPELIRKVLDQKVISHGLSSMGYDVSLSSKELKLFSNINSAEIDPMDIDVEKVFVSPEIRVCPKKGLRYVLVPPNSYLLGFTIETFAIPRNTLVICLGKSTYARAGIGVNVTPIEPGFKGQVVIEIPNFTNLPARVYLESGIAQFVFLTSDEECEVSYADRDGKYQNQTGLTHAKV